MKSKIVIGLLALGLTVLPLQAQEADDPETEVADQPRVGETPESAPAGATSPDIFVPSEEISEDFAVPFPVDI
jgi:hypothetical protein